MSEFIYGMHEEPPGSVWVPGVGGWIVTTHELGHNRNDTGSHDYRGLAGFGVLARLNNGYGEAGTIPQRAFYADFAMRVGNFVEGSRGCRRWIIGNEMNTARERPGGVPITSADYALCFRLCREEIRSRAGHEQDEVIVGAVGPWNVETGDWVAYLQDVLRRIGSNVDGVAVHTYTHGYDPGLVFSNEKMATMPNRYYHFRAYRDIMEIIPMGLPVYITETNGDGPWVNRNTGWVQNAYQEIDAWNKAMVGRSIRALCLYRWPCYDAYCIDGKLGVVDDFKAAQQKRYTWTDQEVPMPGLGLIKNPSFEGKFTIRGVPEVTVGEHWEWGYNRDRGPRPEFRPERAGVGAGHVRTGEFAQKYFTTYSKHEAWLFQQIEGLVPGTYYRFTAHVWIWSSDTNHNGTVSSPPTGKVWVRVGANPWGDQNAMAPSTQYGLAYVDWYDDWIELEVVFKAVTPKAVLFLWSRAEHGVQHNDCYWDDAEIAEFGAVVEPPTEPPTECGGATPAEVRAIVRQELRDVTITMTGEVS